MPYPGTHVPFSMGEKVPKGRMRGLLLANFPLTPTLSLRERALVVFFRLSKTPLRD